ncbi:MAG: zinc ribbon domain-containing protein [Candidatus Omnitrophica bacterium]|nr:zinc ribbon domain-containing protein [Candidatus Omnitrophota bacterium]
MPTYRYTCKKCGNGFEKFQSMTDAPVKKCPDCGGRAVRLIGGGAGLIFKGAGFYQTDYRSCPKKDAPEKGAESGGACPQQKGCACCE